MGKKKNKHQGSEFENDDVYDYDGRNDMSENPVGYPMKLEREYLAMVDDETLYNISRSLQDSINKVSKMNLNPYPWEVELCYLQQEMQARSTRKEHHARWLSTLPAPEME